MRRTSNASAPQAITRGVAHPGKASWSMNRSLKSARPDSSTYSTSRRIDSASARSRSDRAAILAPSPATLPAETMRRQRQLGHQPDPHRAQRRQVGAEAPGQQHLGDLVGLHAQLAQQDVPAGGDRRLGELQLAHVALGEEDRVGRVLAAPVQDEHALLADLGQPGGQRGEQGGGVLVGDEAPGVVEQAGLDELGHGVDQPRAAHAHRLGVADHLERERVVGDLHALDRALGGAHPAADLGRLEGRPGRGGGGDHAVDRAERDLAVGAHVDEQPQPPVAGQAGGEHPGDDVAADVGAQRGEHERRGPRVNRDAEVGGGWWAGSWWVATTNGRHRQRLGIDPQRQLHHRHVAAHGDLVHLLGGDLGLGQHLGGQLGHRLVGAIAQRRAPCRPSSSPRCA